MAEDGRGRKWVGVGVPRRDVTRPIGSLRGLRTQDFGLPGALRPRPGVVVNGQPISHIREEQVAELLARALAEAWHQKA